MDRIANAARRSAERFQGKNGSMSSGAFPPAAAQLSKYHASHSRGLSFQCVTVANSENIVAASRPLYSDLSSARPIYRLLAIGCAFRLFWD